LVKKNDFIQIFIEGFLWVFFSRGKYEDALDLTQQAYSINSHEPITNYFLGNLLVLTKNNHTAAQEYYRRILSIDPTNIYARRQLRLSYCHTMHTTWEAMDCTENKNNCDEKTMQTKSMKCNSMLSEKQDDTTMASANSGSYSSSYHDQNTQCMLYLFCLLYLISVLSSVIVSR
jgi:tetratricopeptide (TPR) repeat protein